jgi:hypothetical protein
MVCDFSNDCGDNSDERNCGNYTRCDFEDELNPYCDWNLDDDALFYWRRQQGQIGSLQTGPSIGKDSKLFWLL